MLYLIRFYEPGSIPHFAKHEELLLGNVMEKIGRCEISKDRGRLFLETDNPEAEELIKEIPGISSFSKAQKCRLSDLAPSVLRFGREMFSGKKTFAVRVKRAGEHMESSHEIAEYLGENILKEHTSLRVDLENPEIEVFVEIRNDDCYIFSEIIRAGKRSVGRREGELKFIADDMVGKLAKRLRILGYDTKYISGVPDWEYLKVAREENRILLTRDTLLSEESGIHTLLIKSTDIKEQLKQVVKEYNLVIDESRMFGICSVDNNALMPVDKEKVKDKVPEQVFENYNEFHVCPTCGRVYWKGSHYDKLMKEFEGL